MKYYHVSIDVFEKIDVFSPKIPEYKLKEEDNKTNRICVAPTIKDCLNGICYCSERMLYKGLFSDNSLCYDFVEGNRVVKVYELEVKEEKILKPSDINKFVPDSYITEEHWIMEDIKPSAEYIIDIVDFELDNSNYIQSVIYNVVDELDIFKSMTIELNQESDANSLYDLFSSEENELLLDFRINGKSINIDLRNFPMTKKNHINSLKDYTENIINELDISQYKIDFK